MEDPHQFFFLFMFMFIFLCSTQEVISSNCTLDFNRFPYEARAECFDANEASDTNSCCNSALVPVFQAMSTRANISKSIFLDNTQAKDCIANFQDIHNRIDLSSCRIQDLISSYYSTNPCFRDMDSIINLLGIEKYDVLRSSCIELSKSSYSDDACFSCAESYRTSLKALMEVAASSDGGGKGNVNDSNGRVCAEALLVTLASSDVGSMTWVQGIFSCLWDEIKLPWPPQKHKKGSLLHSKKLLAAILVCSVLLAILAPIFYKITKRRLRESSKQEIENLSVIVLKNALDDDSTCEYSCSGLYIFSESEIARATNYFDSTNLIAEGNQGKMYLGIMPSGMRVAIKRMNEGMKLHGFLVEISKMAKIRHPNLVSILGYCSRGEQCLVYEYCVNGNLAKWLVSGDDVPVLSWEQRVQIASGVARGLSFLHNNLLQKKLHGNVNLTNIQLNERLQAKLSNFVVSNHIESKSKNGLRTAAADDIFDFGIVLLQLLTGKKTIVNMKSGLFEVRNMVSRGENVCDLVDPGLNGAYDVATFQRLFSIVVLCTSESHTDRPNIQEILNKLQETHKPLSSTIQIEKKTTGIHDPVLYF